MVESSGSQRVAYTVRVCVGAKGDDGRVCEERCHSYTYRG